MPRKPLGGGHEPPSSAATVGYGRPPQHAQFKPGQSGNPSGRPKGSRNLKTQIWDALAAEVEVVINGKPQRISKLQAIAERHMGAALKGDLKAAAFLIELGLKLDNNMNQGANEEAQLPPEDRVILDRFIEKRISERSGSGGNDD